MSDKGIFTYQEIIDQPKVWAKIHDHVHQVQGKFTDLLRSSDEIMFSGCGSAFNVSIVAASTLPAVGGKKARAMHASDIFLFPESASLGSGGTAMVFISRSGDTTETVKALDWAKKHTTSRTLAITCGENSKLALNASEALVLLDASEKSIVTTKSLTAMVLTVQVMAAIMADDKRFDAELGSLSGIGAGIMDQAKSVGEALGNDPGISKFAFVGSGPYHGLAREAQLKIKEMTLLPSDGYHCLEYRHGPKSNVDHDMLVTIMMSDSGYELEKDLLKEVKSLGGRTLALCPRVDPDLERLSDYTVVVGSGLSDYTRGVLYMPVVHFLAYYKALAMGQDPDRPRNLTYYVAI